MWISNPTILVYHKSISLIRSLLFGYYSLCTHFSYDMKYTNNVTWSARSNCVYYSNIGVRIIAMLDLRTSTLVWGARPLQLFAFELWVLQLKIDRLCTLWTILMQGESKGQKERGPLNKSLVPEKDSYLYQQLTLLREIGSDEIKG